MFRRCEHRHDIGASAAAAEERAMNVEQRAEANESLDSTCHAVPERFTSTRLTNRSIRLPPPRGRAINQGARRTVRLSLRAINHVAEIRLGRFFGMNSTSASVSIHSK
jgi:hypothetical protein